MVPIADAFHHACSSVKRWGGQTEDYLPIHQWFDCTKEHFADPRHRAIRHHSQGIGWAIEHFGPTITLSTCRFCRREASDPIHKYHTTAEAFHAFQAKEIPTRWVGEGHVIEDFGHIPTVADFLREMRVQPWMVRGTRKLSIELEV